MEAWKPLLFIVPVKGFSIGKGTLPGTDIFARLLDPQLLIYWLSYPGGLPPEDTVIIFRWVATGYLPTYLPIFVCLYKLTHISKFLVVNTASVHEIKAQKNLTISYCTSKLWFKGRILFQSQKVGVATHHRHQVWLS